MANNITVLDSTAVAQILKTTQTSSVHVPHYAPSVPGGTAFDLGPGTGGAATQRVALDTSQVPATGVAGSSACVPVVLPNNVSFNSGLVAVTQSTGTTAYSAGDVIGSSITAVLTFPTIAPSAGGKIMLTTVNYNLNASALTTGETTFNLHLYTSTPPSSLADNAAFDLPAGDRASYAGKISLGTPTDLGSTCRSEVDSVNKQIFLSSGTMYGYLESVGGSSTQTASRSHTIELNSVLL